MCILATKLKNLKASLRVWKKEVFRLLRHNMSQAEDNVQKAESVYESDLSMTDRISYRHARAIYISHLKNEEAFWRQKYRIKWLAEGEANTVFSTPIVGLRT